MHTDAAGPSRLVRFAAIGVASTLAHLGLYLLLRGVLGAVAANVVALGLAGVANTAANRYLTFGVRGRAGAARHQLQGLVVLALGVALTTGALALLGHAVPDAGRAVETAAIVLAGVAATLLRFALFRAWVFRPRTAPTTA